MEVIAASRDCALLPLEGYCRGLFDDPTSTGRCFRNYALLTEHPGLFAGLGLSKDELFWSRYYWLARFARQRQSATGHDAGLEQQVYQLLESADHMQIAIGVQPE